MYGLVYCWSSVQLVLRYLRKLLHVLNTLKEQRYVSETPSTSTPEAAFNSSVVVQDCRVHLFNPEPLQWKRDRIKIDTKRYWLHQLDISLIARIAFHRGETALRWRAFLKALHSTHVSKLHITWVKERKWNKKLEKVYKQVTNNHELSRN